MRAPNQRQTGRRTTYEQIRSKCPLSNTFPARSEGYRTWPCCTHNPKVAGSNPAPATMKNEGLADVGAANSFRLPRLHPGIGSSAWLRSAGLQVTPGVHGLVALEVALVTE